MGYFRWFMIVTVLAECTGFTLRTVYHQPNHWVYNIFLFVEIFFTGWILYKCCKDYFPVLKVIIPCLTVSLCLYVYESIRSGFTAYSTLSNDVLTVMTILVCCLYYYYFLKKEEFVNIYQHYPFWVVTGLFFFYLGTSACNIFFDYLAIINSTQNKPIRYLTFVVLNFILYSCWSYSFLCRYRQKT